MGQILCLQRAVLEAMAKKEQGPLLELARTDSGYLQVGSKKLMDWHLQIRINQAVLAMPLVVGLG